MLLPLKDLVDASPVQSFGSDEEKHNGPPKDPAAQIDLLISKLDNNEEGSSSQPPALLVTIGTGLPTLPKRLIARVLANKYVDFA